LSNGAANALFHTGELNASLELYNAYMVLQIRINEKSNLAMCIRNISNVISNQRRLATCTRTRKLALLLAELRGDKPGIFKGTLHMFSHYTELGNWETAEKMWQLLDPMGRIWSRTSYREGEAEEEYAKYKFYRGQLNENILEQAEKLATSGRVRATIRSLCKLRGIWQFEQRNYQAAVESLHKAVQMARQIERSDVIAETWLVLVKLHSDQLNDAIIEAERLEQFETPAFRPLAELWLGLGNSEKAKHYALKAYEEAWADGEPYVFRYELNKAAELLTRLGMTIPILSPYDPANEKKLPWEDKVKEIIEQLKREKEEEALFEEDKKKE
jgi:tetratricopeptide (TPR) repeat protein